MRDLRSIVKNVLAAAQMRRSRNELIDAHQAAEQWHYWMGRSLRLAAECDEFKAEHRAPSLGLERDRREAVRKAAEAMQSVPVKWMEVMFPGAMRERMTAWADPQLNAAE